MKKYLFTIGILILGIVSCENDDFCSEDTTPRLVIGFYDKDAPEEYKSVPIYVWAEEKDSIYQLAVVDSIQVPLNTTSLKTRYQLSVEKEIDTINFSYEIDDIYISESCGFIANFKNLTIDSKTENWYSSIEVSNANIENENTAHVKIFH